MKIHVYNSPENELRYFKETVPETPRYPSANADMISGGRAWNQYEQEVSIYNETISRIKKESVLFEDQQTPMVHINVQQNTSIKPDTFYSFDWEGEVEIKIFKSEKDYNVASGYSHPPDKLAVLTPSKQEESQEDIWQTMNPNKPKYLSSTNVLTEGMPKEWLEVWQQVEIWYGDIDKRETGEQLLKRLQESFTITRKKP